MKPTCVRSGITCTMSPESSVPRRRAGAARCRRAKCPPQRSSVEPAELARLALPQLDRRVRAHDPLRVVGVQQHRALEAVRPLDHRRVVVRVRDRDRRQPAERLDGLGRRLVEQRDRTPTARCRSRWARPARAGRSRTAARCRSRSARRRRRTALTCVARQLGDRRPALPVLRAPTGARPRRSGTLAGGALGGGELDAAGVRRRSAPSARLRRRKLHFLHDGGGRGPGRAADAHARGAARRGRRRRAAGSAASPATCSTASRRENLRLVISELVTNALRHGAPRASTSTSRSRPKPEFLCVQVTDDGPGLVPRPRALETDERRAASACTSSSS